jgi:hypothetical protein
LVVTDTSARFISATLACHLAERAANAVAQSKPDLGGLHRRLLTRQIGTADGTGRAAARSSTLVSSRS